MKLSLTEQLVLGILCEKPRHGYSIEKIIVDRDMRKWAEVGFSSIYYVLDRLEKKGLAVSASTKGKEKKQYSITADGVAVLKEETRRCLSERKPANTHFMTGLANSVLLSKDEFLQSLEERKRQIENDLTMLIHKKMVEITDNKAPRAALQLFELSEILINAELNWITMEIEKTQGKENKETARDKYLECKRIFEESSNADNAFSMSKYMKHQFAFCGIQTPLRKKLFRDFLKEEKRKKEIDWDFLDRCYEDEHREFQYLAIDYLTAMKNRLCYNDVFKMLRYIKSKQWWDTIDRFDRLVGDIGLMDRRINDLMLQWAQDDDFWLRRLAIDHQLVRKEKTNVVLLERILLHNLEREEFFINKAIGWSLRAYSKINPNWVRTFINRNRDRMSSLSVKEASKYL